MVKDLTGELIKAGLSRKDINIYHLLSLGKTKYSIAKLLLLREDTVEESLIRIKEITDKIETKLVEKTNDVISKTNITTIGVIK